MVNAKSKTEPDVEDILASIREIIAEEDSSPEKTANVKTAKKPESKAAPGKKVTKPVKAKAKAKEQKKVPAQKPTDMPARKKPPEEDVLILTEIAPSEEVKVSPEPEPIPVELTEEVKKGFQEEAQEAGIEPSPEIDAAMENLVRSMLKEMLKDYLDQHMADIVKKVAAEEILKMKKKS